MSLSWGFRPILPKKKARYASCTGTAAAGTGASHRVPGFAFLLLMRSVSICRLSPCRHGCIVRALMQEIAMSRPPFAAARSDPDPELVQKLVAQARRERARAVGELITR